ncbi:MAG: hypothetical protein WDN49_04965 [Acetobacteraceae bacterium]
MQLRYLQTLTEIGAEQNSTIIFPMPIDIIKPFLDLLDKSGKARSVNGDGRVLRGEDSPLGPTRSERLTRRSSHQGLPDLRPIPENTFLAFGRLPGRGGQRRS